MDAPWSQLYLFLLKILSLRFSATNITVPVNWNVGVVGLHVVFKLVNLKRSKHYANTKNSENYFVWIWVVWHVDQNSEKITTSGVEFWLMWTNQNKKYSFWVREGGNKQNLTWGCTVQKSKPLTVYKIFSEMIPLQYDTCGLVLNWVTETLFLIKIKTDQPLRESFRDTLKDPFIFSCRFSLPFSILQLEKFLFFNMPSGWTALPRVDDPLGVPV